MQVWKDHFNERELQEIEFARRYATEFNHGTDGHIRLTVIAKMADLLSQGVIPAIPPKNIDGSVNPRKPQGFT